MVSVSIVIPVYNSAEFLPQCLKSIDAQTYQNFEVVLVDDCSTDESVDIVTKYRDGHNNVILVRNEKNMGAGWSRRIGIERATRDYVITIDSDDYISPDFLQSLVVRQEETDADIVSAGMTILKSTGGFKAETRGSHVSEGIDKFNDYANKQIVFLNNKIIRRSMYEQVPYCTRRYVEDTPVVVPLLYFANKVANVDNAGYYYRQRGTSLCHTVTQFQDGLFKALCAKDLIEFLKDKPAEYHGLCDLNEYLTHVKRMKANPCTPEDMEKYPAEIAECLMWLLNNVMNFQ